MFVEKESIIISHDIYVKVSFLNYILFLNVWCLEIFIFKMILEEIGNQLDSMENYLQSLLKQTS